MACFERILQQSGKPIGAKDLLIAAQALALGHVLVTDNEGEFARVDGLTVVARIGCVSIEAQLALVCCPMLLHDEY